MIRKYMINGSIPAEIVQLSAGLSFGLVQSM